MVRKAIFIMGFFFFNSCTAQHKLKDGSSVAPDDYTFKNKQYFDNSVFVKIHNENFYELKATYYADINFNKVRASSILGAYFLQFYEDGKVRGIDYLEPDSKISGYRAIIYSKNQNIWMDRAGLSSDRSLKIYTYKLKIDGDKIYLLEIPKTLFKPSEYTCLVYQKSEKIPEEWNKYKADW